MSSFLRLQLERAKTMRGVRAKSARIEFQGVQFKTPLSADPLLTARAVADVIATATDIVKVKLPKDTEGRAVGYGMRATDDTLHVESYALAADIRDTCDAIDAEGAAVAAPVNRLPDVAPNGKAPVKAKA